MAYSRSYGKKGRKEKEMKERRDVAGFIKAQMVRGNKKKKLYGYQELRDLLDYLYDGPPTKMEERLTYYE